LRDDRVAQFGRQVRTHARHGVAHVVHRLLRRLLEPELGRHRDRAVARRRVDVLEPLHAGDGVLDLARDLGLQLGRRGTGQAAVTMIMGRSMSMNCWIFMDRKPITPSSVSMMNSNTAGTGLRIE
jgi:hypothetical protein